MQVSPHTAHATIRCREAPAGEKQPSPTSRYGFVSGLRFPVRSTVTCRHEGPVSVRAACGKTFPHLFRNPPPVGSLRPFGLRHGRCPHHYNAAFASSDILYPRSLRYALRLPTSLRRRNTWLIHVPHDLTVTTWRPPVRRGNRRLRGATADRTSHTPHLLVQACQHL